MTFETHSLINEISFQLSYYRDKSWFWILKFVAFVGWNGVWRAMGKWCCRRMGERRSRKCSCRSEHCDWSWLLYYSWRADWSGSWKVKRGKDDANWSYTNYSVFPYVLYSRFYSCNSIWWKRNSGFVTFCVQSAYL